MWLDNMHKRSCLQDIHEMRRVKPVGIWDVKTCSLVGGYQCTRETTVFTFYPECYVNCISSSMTYVTIHHIIVCTSHP